MKRFRVSFSHFFLIFFGLPVVAFKGRKSGRYSKKKDVKFTQPSLMEARHTDCKQPFGGEKNNLEKKQIVSIVILHFCTALRHLGFILWPRLSAVRSKQGNAEGTAVS